MFLAYQDATIISEAKKRHMEKSEWQPDERERFYTETKATLIFRGFLIHAILDALLLVISLSWVFQLKLKRLATFLRSLATSPINSPDIVKGNTVQPRYCFPA